MILYLFGIMAQQACLSSFDWQLVSSCVTGSSLSLGFGFCSFFGKALEQLFTVLKKAVQYAIMSASQYGGNLRPSMITHTKFRYFPVFSLVV